LNLSTDRKTTFPGLKSEFSFSNQKPWHLIHTRTTKISSGRIKRSSFIRETRQLQCLVEQYPTEVQVTPPHWPSTKYWQAEGHHHKYHSTIPYNQTRK
jgi:hypothetical protein